MNVLVVGGAGYLGGAVTDLLLKTKHQIKVYDALLYEETYRKRVDFVYGDVRDKKKLLPYLKWADAIIWLAALVGDGACALNPEVSFEINTQPLQLLENINKRVIFTSTCSVYGEHKGLLNERSPVKPLSVYASTKLAAEKYLTHKNALIFRIGTLFGLGDNYSRIRMDLVINTLTAKAFFEKKLNVFGGDQYRPVLHVFDAARAIVGNVGSHKKGIYNLSSENIKIIDLARKYKKHFKDLDIEVSPLKFEDARNYSVSTEKANKELKFKPKISIDEGIIEIKKLLEEHRVKDIGSPRYTNQVFLQMFNTHLLKNDQS